MKVQGVLSALRDLKLKSGIGVFAPDADVHRVEVGWTLTGFRHDAGPRAAGGDGVAASEMGAKAPTGIAARLPQSLRPLLGRRGEGRGHQGAQGPIMVGLRANAVTFLSEVVQEQAMQPLAAPDREEQKIESGERRAATVLSDSITVTVGKQKMKLTGKVRLGELDALERATGLDPCGSARYEPEPWAAWRASAHYAPFKPKKGIHLRYILGDQVGLAVLGTPKHPLAWQVLSWEDDGKEVAILQAFHLLSVHAVRRLHLSGIDHISVQGEDHLEADWDAVEEAIGLPVIDVDGPNYDADFIAFGLALGAMEARTETFNLARRMQAKPTLMAMAPWGEAGFLLSLFLCMFLVLNDHASNLRQELAKTNKQHKAVVWAQGINQAKLNAEQKTLSAQVTPLQRYLKRELYFGDALTAIAGALPDSTWLDSIAGGDFIWEKNPNKILGERYLLVQAGAPSVSRGMAPPEIDHAVKGFERNEYLKSTLPRIKLTDVNWRQQAGSGYTVFSVLALPKK